MKKYLAFFLSVILIVASCMNTLIYVFAQNETVFKIDFEGQQGTFIQNNPVTDSSKVASIEQTQSNGNVMHIKKLNVYRTDGWNPSATILWPSMFRLPNNNGTDTLYFEKDQVLKVNFKIKKNEAYASSEFFSEITVALVFADSYDGGATNNVRTYVDNNQTVTLTEIDLTADNNFVEYETTISVPKSGYAAFLLYGQQWGGNCNIYVDDITITETKNFVTVTDSTLNTYDEQGATYQNIDGNTGAESNDTVSYNTSKNLCGSRTYQNNTLTIGYFDTVIEKYDDTNGYAAHFGYHANALDKGNGNYDKWPQMLRIYDSDLSDLGQFTPKANTTYTITFDYRFDEKTSKDKSAIFNLVYTKAEEPSYLISGKTEDILVKEQIAVVPMGTKTDGWVKAAATFTTDGNVGALFLTLNSSYWWSEIDAWVDNIKIVGYSNVKDFEMVMHNIDGDGNDGIKNVNALTDFSTVGQLTSDKYTFDGLYLDSEFTQKAEGFVGSINEVWVKWKPNSSLYTLNTYDEQGTTYQNIDGNTGAESNDTVSYNTSKNLCGNRTYQNNTLTIGYFDTVIEKYDDTNGYAAHFGYHANALDKGNNKYDYWPQMLRIYSSESSDLEQFTPKANTTYTITFDYRFDEKTAKDKSAIFNLVYTKAEEPSYLISGKTEDILVKEQIAVVPMGTKTDGWVKAAATFTTGGNVGALFLTLNSSYWWSEIDAWVDNIEITSFSDMSEFSLTVHNNDGKNGDASFTVNPLTKINELDSPYSRLGAFEGYYLDSALSKKAEGYIGNAKELWVKWRTEKDKTVNTYDEKNVEFVTEKDGNNYTMTNRIIDGKQINENYFAHYNVTIDEAIKNSKITNAVKFMNAQKHTWNWPAIVKIYDNKYDDLRLFVPKPNSAYKIKFKYSTDENTAVTLNFQIRALNDDGSTKFNETKVYNDELVSIKSATLWNEAEAIFYTGSEVTPLFLTLVSTTGSAQENIEIYIDDVVVEEVFGIRTISFDTVGGEPKSSIICCPEEKIPVITPPTKEGFVFEGWFLDSSYTIPFSYSKMPNSNIELFAKWSEKIENAYDFISDFESNLYSNTGVNNISNNVISQKVEWKNADDAYSGKGYIRMHPVGDVSQISHEIPTFALLDNDFNTYKIVPGARYRITFAMRCEKTQQVNFACSQQVPSIGVNQYNSNIVATQNYHDLLVDTKMGEWGTYELYVMPSVGGKLYVMAYGDSNCYVDIDDLKIEKVDESVASTVTYYLDENTIKETKFGKVGTTLTDVAIANTETQIFNGWRYADGKLFTDGFFQNKDVKVYASWKDRETTEISTQWKSKIIDFEDSENAKIFYSTINNSSEANRGTYYVMGDSKNARSGNSYFRLENAGAWVSVKNNLRYRFFDKDSSNHMVNLEPASVYRVTFWINLEKVGYTSLMISTFENNDSMDEYLFDTQIILSDASQIANLGKWIQLESNVVTGSEPSTLGMVISGGWISGCIDDIEITKLENVTLSFDSNGGSKVEPIKVMSYSCAVEPEYPEKEGYTFAGWYADKQLTKKFNFNKTKLVTDTMVYAKWIKDFVPEKYSKEFYTYEEIEIEKPNEISDNYLDAQINISNIKSNVYEETEEDNLILPISIISGAILFTGLVTFFIILMVKRKKRKEK